MEQRTQAIQKGQDLKSVKWIVKNAGIIRFDLAIQRNTVWSDEQKSLMIHSILYGYPFPAVYAHESADGLLWMLDGKQRLTTVISFVKGGFALSKKTPSVFGVEIAGLKFDELTEDFQDLIMDTDFNFWTLKGMSTEEVDEMFFRLNNGSPLTKLEVTRSMYSDLFADINDLANLEFFSDAIHLTTSARNRFVDQELVVQIAMLLDNDHDLKGFGGSHIRDYVLNLKDKDSKFGDEMYKIFNEMSEWLSEAFADYSKKDRAKALKKINVPMVFFQGLKAKEMGLHPRHFGQFIKWYLVEIYNTESAYGQACQSGSAKKENVLVRLKEMDKNFNKYIKKHPIEKYLAELDAQNGQKEVATGEEGVKKVVEPSKEPVVNEDDKDEPTPKKEVQEPTSENGESKEEDKKTPPKKRNSTATSKAKGEKKEEEVTA